MKSLIAVLVSVATFGMAHGATLHVDYENGSDEPGASIYKTVGYAVGQSAANDEIVLAAGLHPLAAKVTVDKAVTIRGAGAPEETLIDGEKKNVGVVLKVSGATLRDLTFQNTKGDWTPALTTESGTVVSNVVLTGLSNDWHEDFLLKVGSLITGCRFVANSNPNGTLFKFGATMENCLVASNTASSFFNLQSMNAIIRNSTIVSNACGGANVVLPMGYKAMVYNNILWNNVNVSGVANWSGADKTENWINNCTMPTAGLGGSGNIGDDPMFLADGCHIKKGSPCNHGAKPAYATKVDIDGFDRGDKPSIGAYEYVDLGELEVTISNSASFVRSPETITLTPVIVGTYSGTPSYSWDLKGDGTMISTDEKPVLSAVGSYLPKLTVTIGSGESVVTSLSSPLVVHATGAQTYHVDYANGDNDNDGMTSATAWKTVPFAIGSPMMAGGDEVVLARGLHSLAADMKVAKAITIRGAGAPDETQVDGNNARSMTLETSGAALRDLTLRRLTGADSINKTVAGTLVSNVVFSVFADGWSKNAIEFAGCVSGCRFVGTQSHNTLINLKDAAVFENCLAVSNSVSTVVLVSGGVTVRNCTIADNTALGLAAHGLGSVQNTIVRGNSKASEMSNWEQWNDWAKNWTHVCTSPTDGLPDSANFDADPLFSTKRPHHLTAASPCRNAGSNELTTARVDLDGRPRKIGRRVDLGCFECDMAGLSLIVR